MNKVLIYSTAICPYCTAAKSVFNRKGVEFEEVRIDTDPVRRNEMMQKTRRTSVPQIFVGDHHVGGYDELLALDRAGDFDRLLEGDS